MFLPAMDTRCATSSQVVCMKRRRCTTSSEVDFMKRRKYTTTSQVVLEDDDLLTSSQVVLKDDDLLTLILLRVPFVELLSLMWVSKQWLSLITTPHFTRLLRDSITPLRASGLFIQPPGFLDSLHKVYFVSLDNPNSTPSLTFSRYPFYPEKIRIILSCNGLLLCSNALFRPKRLRKYYVYNPFTNRLETLPEHPPRSGHWVRYVTYAGLAFDPLKSIHYKVIAFESTSTYPSPHVGNFYIYSSETGTWKASVESFSPPRGVDFSGGVYWNGCIHWLSQLNSESEAESTVSDCLWFNVDEERFETFPRPPTGVRSASRRNTYFGESEGHLHFVEACPYATSLDVYEMKSDYSGWFLKYQIDLDPISKVFPEMTKHKAIFHDKNDYAVAVPSLIRREKFREDPFLVLEIPGKVIRYNLVTRSVKMIWDFSVDFSLQNIDDWPLGNLKAWQYVESV